MIHREPSFDWNQGTLCEHIWRVPWLDKHRVLIVDGLLGQSGSFEVEERIEIRHLVRVSSVT
jgi:uncharacterized protein (DUF779 family)